MTTQDHDFSAPYVDVDEWRDAPVRHRYLHGGFTGSETRFSLYFPGPEQYRGRFFQHITPVPLSENLAQSAVGQEDRIGFAISSGAYFVESNSGGASGGPGSQADPMIAAYRANAEVARYSRVVAQEVYGRAHRPFGYAYGGSGGAFRTIAAAENTEGVWDGFVPYVVGSPMAPPNVFTVRMHAQRVLRRKFDAIVDALEPGGSGDPYADLNEEERAALTEVTRMGFPPRSWFGYRTMGMHAFSVLYPGFKLIDPGYFSDFWEQDGYLGADPASSVHQDRVRLTCAVAAIVTRTEAAEQGLLAGGTEAAHGGVDNAFKAMEGGAQDTVAIRLSDKATGYALGAILTVTSGDAAGTSVGIKEIQGDIALLDEENGGLVPAGLKPGDVIEIDNSTFLAAQTYHRHQVPSAEFRAWDQYRGSDGSPLHPQRPVLLGPLFAAGAGGTLQSGRISGKMISLACLLDREAFPWHADWYRSKVREHLGEATDEHFRLWYIDNALHADDEQQEHPTHTVSYLGALHHALRDVAAWVEEGKAPAASTVCTVDDAQVSVPAGAGERLGVQPVVRLTADGAERVVVRAGQPFTVRAVAEASPNAGPVVRLAWDFSTDGAFPVTERISPAERVTAERTHAFDKPGTYFVTVLASTQRDGDTATPFARIDNLARLRVVVR